MAAAPGALPPSNHPLNDPDVSKVPDASGRVHVLAAVMLAEVSVPVYAVPFPGAGRIANLSELAVEEAKTAEPVVPRLVVKLVAGAVFNIIPPVPDEMFIEVVPVELPSVIALAKASVPKFKPPVPV